MRFALIASACWIQACSSPVHEAPSCTGTQSEALFNATTRESYLGVPDTQIRAIVAITNGLGPDAPLCTGTFVARDWIVTARHCSMDSPEVAVHDEHGERLTLPILEQVPHPSVDVALMRVDGAGIDALDVLPPMRSGERTLGMGDLVELAGYGLTETGTARELRFVVEGVTDVDDENIVVDGLGRSGACAGDSGGPLLVRDASGAVAVAGILSTGSPSCLEHDRYLRLEPLRAWIETTTGPLATELTGCGGIDEQGRCLYGSAIWCQKARIVAEPCANDLGCGWDGEAMGYRCVSPASDPCRGVDALGRCDDGAAWWCGNGVLEGQSCDCGQTCRIDANGGPRCMD